MAKQKLTKQEYNDAKKAECIKIRGALSSKAMRVLEERTGIAYNYVWRTMNGQFVNFNEKRETIVKAAKAYLKEQGITLK